MAKYTDTQALRVILDRVTLCETHWRPVFDKFNEIYEVYKFYTSPTPSVTRGERSNIFVPYAFAQVETKLPREIQAIMAYDPFFEVYGVGEEDNGRAEFVQNLLHHQTKNEIDTFFAIMMWKKECAIYGNSFMFIPWIKEVRNLKKKIPQYIGQEIVGYDYIRKPVVKRDAPDLQPIDIFDCLPCPYGARVTEMPYFIVRSEPTGSYLKEMRDKGVFKKKEVGRLLEKSGGAGYIDKNREERMLIKGLSKLHVDDPYEPRFEMYTMWEKDWVVRVIDNVIVQNSETPFDEEEIPLVGAIDTPVQHELFGFGQIEPIMKLNYYANDIVNLNLDQFFQRVNPGMLVKRSAKLNIANYEVNPSGIHEIDGDNAMYPVREGGVPNDAINNLGVLERIMNLTTGGGDIIRGMQASKGDQTAREVMSLIEQANYRFDLTIRLFKEFSLKRMLKMLTWRNQQYLPYEKAVRIHNAEGVEYPIYTPDDIMGSFDYYLKISPVQGNKSAWANNLMRFLEVINNSQGSHPELVEQIGQALGLTKAGDYVRNHALEAAQIIAQAQQEGLMKNAQQAFALLGHIFNMLAPPGSPNAKKLAGRLGQAQNQKTRPQGQGPGQGIKSEAAEVM